MLHVVTRGLITNYVFIGINRCRKGHQARTSHHAIALYSMMVSIFILIGIGVHLRRRCRRPAFRQIGHGHIVLSGNILTASVVIAIGQSFKEPAPILIRSGGADQIIVFVVKVDFHARRGSDVNSIIIFAVAVHIQPQQVADAKAHNLHVGLVRANRVVESGRISGKAVYVEVIGLIIVSLKRKGNFSGFLLCKLMVRHPTDSGNIRQSMGRARPPLSIGRWRRCGAIRGHLAPMGAARVEVIARCIGRVITDCIG